MFGLKNRTVLTTFENLKFHMTSWEGQVGNGETVVAGVGTHDHGYPMVYGKDRTVVVYK